MLTGRQLTGLPIRDSVNGKIIGRVCDIYGDLTSGQIRGFGVRIDKLLSRTMLLPASAVESIGISGMIADVSAIKPLYGHNDTVFTCRGALLRSAAGSDLGVVSDVIVDEGHIAGFEISGGLLADVAIRRSVVAHSSVRGDEKGDFIKIKA